MDIMGSENPICVVSTYVNGTSGYRIWSDGYCEQWGRVDVTFGTEDTYYYITYIKPFTDTNYRITVNVLGGYSGHNIAQPEWMSTTSFTGYATSNVSSEKSIMWKACGYIS